MNDLLIVARIQVLGGAPAGPLGPKSAREAVCLHLAGLASRLFGLLRGGFLDHPDGQLLGREENNGRRLFHSDGTSSDADRPGYRRSNTVNREITRA